MNVPVPTVSWSVRFAPSAKFADADARTTLLEPLTSTQPAELRLYCRRQTLLAPAQAAVSWISNRTRKLTSTSCVQLVFWFAFQVAVVSLPSSFRPRKAFWLNAAGHVISRRSPAAGRSLLPT